MVIRIRGSDRVVGSDPRATLASAQRNGIRGGSGHGDRHGRDGAVLAPDASWIGHRRLAALTAEERAKFLPLCPDFVIELRSPTDGLSALQEKMHEYMENGARLGWLIDPLGAQVFVYRSGAPVERLEQPESVPADPVLPGFRLELAEIL